MQQWLELVITQIKDTPLIVWVSLAAGVAEVLLARVNNVWLYPAGIISTITTVFVFVEIKLYAEAALNIYYLVMSIYGWFYWVKKKDEPPVKVSWSTRSEWLITALISFAGWAVIWFILVRFTDSNVPMLDAFVSSTAWAGTWLLARRKIENWLVLNVSNLIAIPLLFYKQQPMYALVTVFLFVVAIFGHIKWVRIWRQENAVKSVASTL